MAKSLEAIRSLNDRLYSLRGISAKVDRLINRVEAILEAIENRVREGGGES